MVAINKIIKSRYLPERSYLYYQYPDTNERSIEFYFPLLENIDISESQRPNLGVYDLLGRPGNLYSYHGAKSREFNLRFNITLPNIADYITNIGLHEQFADSFRYFYNERDREKRRLKRNSDKNNKKTQNFDLDRGNEFGVPYSERAENRYSSLLPPPTGAELVLQQIAKWTNNAISDFESFLGLTKQTPKQARNSIDYLILLINVIRTSTLNNSRNTSMGPPTIYINHGTMYNNIPCICTNYNVRLVSENGYHLTTMTPKQVEVTMNLSENRVGDFGLYQPFTLIQGENIVGWEAIIEERTLDPWNNKFGEYDSDVSYNAIREQEEAAAAAALKAGAGNKGNLTNQQILDLARDPVFGDSI
jgi:hypothetical protein